MSSLSCPSSLSDPVRGIVVNDKLRTSNKKIYAAGDVASEYHFTYGSRFTVRMSLFIPPNLPPFPPFENPFGSHAADFLARIVIRNAMFKGSSKASKLVIPYVTCRK